MKRKFKVPLERTIIETATVEVELDLDASVDEVEALDQAADFAIAQAENQIAGKPNVLPTIEWEPDDDDVGIGNDDVEEITS